MAPFSLSELKGRLSASSDLTEHRYTRNRESLDLHLLYYDSLVDRDRLHKAVLSPFVESADARSFVEAVLSFGAERTTDEAQAVQKLTEGYVLAVTGEEAFLLQVRKRYNEEPGKPVTENTLVGPQKGLSESLTTNLNLIRSRYPKKELTVEFFEIGADSKTRVALLTDSSRADRKMWESIRARLLGVQVDVLQSSGQLMLFLNGKKYSLFPTAMLTERADRLVLNLSKGKVVLLVDGTPFALVLPAVFFDFMAAMDDLYNPFWISRFLIVLRYVALMATLLLPAVYISIISYNPEIARVQLTLSIAGSRAAVPYSAPYEVLIMLFLTEALVEASLRLPRYIGSTATTVGGLILGQAAQQAGLVSSIMIIVTSAVAISNFVIPVNEMSFAMRIYKYVLILFASFFGIVGTAAGLFLLVAYLSGLQSFGEPYLRIRLGERNTALPKR